MLCLFSSMVFFQISWRDCANDEQIESCASNNGRPGQSWPKASGAVGKEGWECKRFEVLFAAGNGGQNIEFGFFFPFKSLHNPSIHQWIGLRENLNRIKPHDLHGKIPWVSGFNFHLRNPRAQLTGKNLNRWEIHGRFSSLEKLLKMTRKNDGTII